MDEVKARRYNLDFKNPHTIADEHPDPEVLLATLEEAERQTIALQNELKMILGKALQQ
jgi:type I restriction enzyme M protein